MTHDLKTNCANPEYELKDFETKKKITELESESGASQMVELNNVKIILHYCL